MIFRTLFLGFALFTAAFTAGSQENTSEVYIVHTNDIHGHIKCYADGTGGFSNYCLYLKDLRAAGKCDILMDTGDLVHKGDFIDKNSGGEATFMLFDLLGYDAFIPGNNELKENFDQYLKFRELLKAPMLVINIKKGDDLIGDAPYVFLERKGIKFCIMGLSFCGDTEYLSSFKGWEDIVFLAPLEAVEEKVAEVRPFCDILILGSHNGTEFDRKVLGAAPEIDLLISGHDHARSSSVFKGDSGERIFEAGCYLTDLGHITLVIDDATKKIASGEQILVNIEKRTGKDPLGSKIRKLDKKYNKEGRKVIGVLEESLSGFADSAAFTAGCFIRATKAKCAVINDGTERELLRKGRITVEMVYMKSPYKNNVVVCEMTPEFFNKMKEDLRDKKNILFYGNPGDSGKISVAMDAFMADVLGLKAEDTGITVQKAQIDFLTGKK